MFPQFIGSPGYQHGCYTFYKAFKYYKKEKCKILMLGEFFFVKISSDDDPCIGELQLLWEDRNSDQMLSSVRLYFLPEQTPLGRQPHHGEHEIIAATEKVILRLDDLVSWITDEVDWNHGLRGIYKGSVKFSDQACLSQLTPCANGSIIKDGTNLARAFTDNNSGLDFEDINKEKELIGDGKDSSALGICIITYPKYLRYCAMLQRLGDRVHEWLSSALILALGGFTVSSNNVYILFCRDYFDHEGLSQSDVNCEHLAPTFKGRPRKKKTKYGADFYSDYNINKVKPKIPKKPLGQAEESFLQNLFDFMKSRNTPIHRVPNLGFKQIDLYLFFSLVQKLGGYEQITHRKQWKVIYDELGGNPGSTSAATCTRRHYERLLLPYERHVKGEEDKPLPPPPPPRIRSKKASPDKDKNDFNQEDFPLYAENEMPGNDKLHDLSNSKDEELDSHDEYSESNEEKPEWLAKVKEDITFLTENCSSIYAINKNISCEEKEKKWNEIRMKNALARNWARQLRPLKVGMKGTLERYQRMLKDAMQLHQTQPKAQSESSVTDFSNLQVKHDESYFKTVSPVMPLLPNSCIVSKSPISNETFSFKNNSSNLASSEHAYYHPAEHSHLFSRRLDNASRMNRCGASTTGIVMQPVTSGRVHPAVSISSNLFCSNDTAHSISTVVCAGQTPNFHSSKCELMIETDRIKPRNNFSIMSPLTHRKICASPNGESIVAAYTNEKYPVSLEKIPASSQSTDKFHSKDLKCNSQESGCFQLRPSVICHTELTQSVASKDKTIVTSSHHSDFHQNSQPGLSSPSTVPFIGSQAGLDRSNKLTLLPSKNISSGMPIDGISLLDKTTINFVEDPRAQICKSENMKDFQNNGHIQLQYGSPRDKLELREFGKGFEVQSKQQCIVTAQKRRSLSMSSITSQTLVEEHGTKLIPGSDTHIISQEFSKENKYGYKAKTPFFEQTKRARLNSSPISFSDKCDITRLHFYKMSSGLTLDDANAPIVLDLSTKKKPESIGLDDIVPSPSPPKTPADGMCLDLSLKRKIDSLTLPSSGIENITPPPEEIEPPLYQSSPFVVSVMKSPSHLSIPVISSAGSSEVFSDITHNGKLCSDISSNRISILTSENPLTSSLSETSGSMSPSQQKGIKSDVKNSIIYDYNSSKSLAEYTSRKSSFWSPQTSHYISSEDVQTNLGNYKEIVDEGVILQYQQHTGHYLYPVLFNEGQTYSK